jgi:hypothetical protein
MKLAARSDTKALRLGVQPCTRNECTPIRRPSASLGASRVFKTTKIVASVHYRSCVRTWIIGMHSPKLENGEEDDKLSCILRREEW